jgi:HD-like signal output (HDOD) protein
VQSAVVILGFNTLKSIVLSASVMDAFSSVKQPRVFEKSRFWKHSIVCAFAAKRIAQRLMKRKTIDPESAFCAGIMHDIGKLIFELFIPQEYAVLCQRASLADVSLVEEEVASMGIDHAQAGRILADRWTLPFDLENAIVYHHKPWEATNIKELVSIVHLADAIAHRLGCGLWDNEKAPMEWIAARSVLGIEEGIYQQGVDALMKEIGDYQDVSLIAKG